jgi:hypothetical protein
MVEVYTDLASIYTLHDYFARFAWELNEKLILPLIERVL